MIRIWIINEFQLYQFTKILRVWSPFWMVDHENSNSSKHIKKSGIPKTPCTKIQFSDSIFWIFRRHNLVSTILDIRYSDNIFVSSNFKNPTNNKLQVGNDCMFYCIIPLLVLIPLGRIRRIISWMNKYGGNKMNEWKGTLKIFWYWASYNKKLSRFLKN